ncbi:MAG: 40S ribosomal protein [Paramarteilia canceri]
MGVDRSGRTKHRASGAKRRPISVKKKDQLARPSANTKIGTQKVKQIKCRGNVKKLRALALNKGNFAIANLGSTAKSSIHTVKYHPSNMEIVRSDILVKNCIVEIDATPIKMMVDKLKRKNPKLKVDKAIETQLSSGSKILARIASRPGQSGRADGVILEGKEYNFYLKKISKK